MKFTMRKAWLSGATLLCLLLVVIVALGCMPRYETLEVDGRKRHYLLHVPDNLPADASVPLVLALHQFSDTPRGMQQMTGFDAMADREGFIVAYPKGIWRMWRSRISDDDRDIRFLLALMDALSEKYSIDADRIYATGASAGAVMIQALACHTDRLAAIAPVMGSLTAGYSGFNRALPPLSVLVMHGTDDPVVPFAGGRAGGPHEMIFLSAQETGAFWARAAGCNDEPRVISETLDTGAVLEQYIWDCAEDTQVLLYAVGGCGHSWPGHNSRYPAFIVGASVETPNASTIIWDFFNEQQ